MGDLEPSAREPTGASRPRPVPRIRGRRLAVQTLTVDALAVEVSSILAAEGIPNLLLKGPVLGRTLYDDGTLPPYRDCDILVAEACLIPAGAALRSAGFECDFDERDAHALINPHAQYWRRPPSRLLVDLHWMLDGVRADSETLWREFSSGSEPMPFHHTTVQAPSRSRIALLVALHAAQHGRQRAKPLEDLQRALDRFEPAVWEEANRLATRLQASEAFAAGLSLLEAGGRLAAGLELRANPGAELAARLQRPTRGAAAVGRVLDTPGARGKARALLALAFPPVSYMRYSFALARRGRAGLVAAYTQRLLARGRQLPAAARAVRSSRPR
jgi:Uncharacterised nucleotidyltransferase